MVQLQIVSHRSAIVLRVGLRTNVALQADQFRFVDCLGDGRRATQSLRARGEIEKRAYRQGASRLHDSVGYHLASELPEVYSREPRFLDNFGGALREGVPVRGRYCGMDFPAFQSFIAKAAANRKCCPPDLSC